MKISNKREFQQIAFNHSSDIDFKDFMNLCKKMFCKCTTDALTTASKKAIQKTVEAIGDLISNIIANILQRSQGVHCSIT